MSHLLGGNRTLRVLHFGSRLVRYSEGLALQESLAEQRKLDHIPDTLLVLQVGSPSSTQHPHMLPAVACMVFGTWDSYLHENACCCPFLIYLQHSPVYTIGKRGREADFRVPVQVCYLPPLNYCQYQAPALKLCEAVCCGASRQCWQHGVPCRSCSHKG
jgi:hypothetical protein